MTGLVKNIIFFGAIAAAGYGAYYYFSLQAELIKNADYQITNIQFQNFTLQDTSVLLTLALQNNSSISATCKQLYADVYVNNVKVGFVSQTTPFDYPAHSVAPITVNADFSPIQILGNSLNLTSAIGNSLSGAVFSLVGYAQVQSGIISATIPLNIAKTYAL